jgi:tripartite-type tricarboxylate transporter receptor subunit TctC
MHRELRRGLVFVFGLFAALAAAALGSAFWAAAASADQAWPTRPVKFILTLGPGSGADIGARLFADRLAQRWGQPVVVENRPGGDGIVAINTFVGAHDDHQLLFSPTSSFTAHPFLHDHLPYRPSDLAPVARISNTVIAIAVPASLNAANDLAEGRVQVYESALAIVRPQLQSGKIELLAVTNTVRAPSEPDVPTVEEAGQPALTIDGLVGLFEPADMPIELRRRISADVGAVADDTIKARLATTGQLLNIGGPEEFKKSIDAQRAQVETFAKELGIAEMPQD